MTKKMSNSEIIQHTTVRLECQLKNGRLSVGTGFYFAFEKNENNYDRLTIITNKHVIKDSLKLTIHLTPIDNEGLPQYSASYSETLDVAEKDWIFHPEENVDLCALPFGAYYDKIFKRNGEIFLYPFSKMYLADTEKLEDLNAIETITMVGYPNGIWDRVNNIPVVRQGITASHPKLNYNGKSETLIDCACFPGSSGSPVLVFNPGGYTTKEGNFDLRARLILLGILYAGPQYQADGTIKSAPISTLPNLVTSTYIQLNLGYVIKSEKILDFDLLIE